MNNRLIFVTLYTEFDFDSTFDVISFNFREYTQKSLDEIELFINQKKGDFKSLLINFVQLQMHMHKKVMSLSPNEGILNYGQPLSNCYVVTESPFVLIFCG